MIGYICSLAQLLDTQWTILPYRLPSFFSLRSFAPVDGYASPYGLLIRNRSARRNVCAAHPLIPESSGRESLTKTGYRHATIPSPSVGFLCSLFWRVSGIPLLPPANESDAVTYILVSGSGIPATSWGWPNDKS